MYLVTVHPVPNLLHTNPTEVAFNTGWKIRVRAMNLNKDHLLDDLKNRKMFGKTHVCLEVMSNNVLMVP